jgi:glutamyl-tRNA synthetase
MQYRDEGYLPEALLNYLVRLGWSMGDQEIFSMKEMCKYFSIDHLSRSPAIFNPGKLAWLNQQYLKTLSPEYIANALAWHFEQLNIDLSKGPKLSDVVLAQRERCKTLKEMAEKSLLFYQNQPNISVTLDPAVQPALIDLIKRLTPLDHWQADALHDIVNAVVAEHQIKFVQLGKPLRELLLGNATSSLPIHSVMQLLGKEKVLQKLGQYAS